MRTRRPGAPTPTAGTARLLRVTGLGGASLLLACAAHTLGGGRPPAAGVLIVAGIVLGLVAATVTVRRCRLGLLLALLAVEQAVLHVVFDAAASATASAAAGCGGLVSGTAPHHAALGHPLSACPVAPGMSTGMSSLPGLVMLAAHLAATALTALLLAQGETWLWRAADRIIAAATATPGRRSKSRQPLPAAPNTLAAPVTRAAEASRGPPVILVAA